MAIELGATAQGAKTPEDSAARASALSRDPDPMLAAFTGQPTPPEDARSAAVVTTEGAPQAAPGTATPPPVTPGGNLAANDAPRTPEPSPQPPASTPDFDHASPEDIRAWAQKHPVASKAMGLEVREQLQRRDAQMQNERQARAAAEQQAQAAQQQAAQAQEQARLSTELYGAYYDQDDPRHLDALRHFADLGVAPVEIQQVIASPVVQQHVGQVANMVAQQAQQQAFAASIQAAANDPLLGALGEDALEDVWQASDGTITGFYRDAYRKAGYLDPKTAQEFRAAAREEANSRVYGNYPPAEGSVVQGGNASPAATRVPADKRQIDPTEWFTRGFSQPARA